MFKDDVRALINVAANGELSCKLTAEQREAIQRIQTAANTRTQTLESANAVKSVEIAAAIESMSTRSETQDTSGVYADEIHMVDHKDQIHEYQCTVSKATNVATAKIIEAAVWKAYCVMRMTHSVKGAAARNFIRTDWGDLFIKPQAQAGDRLIKSTSMKDTVLSATIFPQDVRQTAEFIEAIEAGIALKAKMLAEFLQSLQGADEATALTAYRNINRSMLDEIFNSQYAAYMGRVNEADPVSVSNYLDALKDYRESLAQVGSIYLSSDTVEFGLNIRKLSISPSVSWSNMEKIGRVKRFGSGSYYVSSNEDTGLGKIPTSPSILASHMDEIVSLTDHCMALVENEARLQNGFDAIEVPKIPTIPAVTDDIQYADMLGITKDTETRILQTLQQQAQDLARTVCERNKENKSSKNIEAVMNLMGR